MNFDFRTKLIIILITMSLVAVITSDILIYTLICALSVYLIIQGYKKQALIYDIACIIFIFLRFFSNGNGLTFLMPEMFLFMVPRMMLMAMAAKPVIGMAPGEAISVFKKIHLSTSLGLPLTFKKRKNNSYFVMQNTDCSLFGDSVENELRLNKKNADDKYIDKILRDYNLLSYKENHPS